MRFYKLLYIYLSFSVKPQREITNFNFAYFGKRGSRQLIFGISSWKIVSFMSVAGARP